MTNPITITLSPDEALVLQEFFARFAESNEFSLSHNSEFIAFMRLSRQLDRASVVPFQDRYAEHLSAAQERLVFGFEGTAPGVKPRP